MAAAPQRLKARTACKYGNKCYRRNPQHLKDYTHPNNDEDEQKATAPGKATETKKKTITDFFSTSTTKPSNKSDSDTDSDEQPPLKKRCSSSTEKTLPLENSKPSSVDNEDDKADEKEESEEVSAETYPEDERECIKKLFLVDMPEDFYNFWDFCKALNKKDPSAAFRSIGLYLSGPYDILAGKHMKVVKNKHKRRPNFLLHQRFFYDPPEFQTVLISEETNQFHIGYFRDDSKEMPVFLASNAPAAKSSKEKINPCGDNIFAAVHLYATQKLKTEKGVKKKDIEKLLKSLEEKANELNLSLAATTKQMKERQKKTNCNTFHGAGMVVPVDANEVGYRPVPETEKDLKAMLRKICDGDTETVREAASEELQEIITFVQFANDECDYGEGLELGLCLFSYGRVELHPQILCLLPLAYQLLDRQGFQEIIEAHINCRKRPESSVDELEV